MAMVGTGREYNGQGTYLARHPPGFDVWKDDDFQNQHLGDPEVIPGTGIAGSQFQTILVYSRP